MLDVPITAFSVHPSENISEHALFELNSDLKLTVLRNAFERDGRLLIPEILQPSDGLALYRCLERETQWGLMVGLGPGVGRHYATAGQCQQFTATQHKSLHDSVHAFGCKDATHLFGARPVACDEFDRAADGSILARFVEFLMTETFMCFAREVTRAHDIQTVSAQATCFRAGHFCGFHTDTNGEDNVRASCVFGFTPEWNREWGGLLHFKSAGGEIEDTHVPGFNSLSLFNASQLHGVSVISDHAARARYSITAVLIAQ